MRSTLLVPVGLLAGMLALAAVAAEPAPTTSAPAGPQITGSLRIVKTDGTTVIQEAPVAIAGTPMKTIKVSASSAFLSLAGKCAFNVRYDEISDTAAVGTTNRIYSNDALIVQNTKVDLAPHVKKTLWVQPYLMPGQNNVKLVINAESARPSIGWVRIDVDGRCGTPPTAASQPATAPTVVKYSPGSAQWHNLYNAWGYGNYATTQLKGKGYPRYDDLAALDAALTTTVHAAVVTDAAYASLMARWNTFLADPAFEAAMAAIVPTTPGVK